MMVSTFFKPILLSIANAPLCIPLMRASFVLIVDESISTPNLGAFTFRAHSSRAVVAPPEPDSIHFITPYLSKRHGRVVFSVLTPSNKELSVKAFSTRQYRLVKVSMGTGSLSTELK